MRTAIAMTSALFLSACGITGKDISVAEYNTHMTIPFERVSPGMKFGGGEVILIGQASAAEARLVRDAVRALNAGLPSCAQLTIRTPRPDYSLKGLVTPDGKFGKFVENTFADGQTLHVQFVENDEHYSGKADGTSWGPYVQLVRGKANVRTAVHEMGHSMGIYGHVPLSVRSVMEADTRGNHDIPGYLSKSDKAVLAHLYPCG